MSRMLNVGSIAINDAFASNTTPVVLDLRHKVAGKRFHERHPKNNATINLQELLDILSQATPAQRSRVQVLDLSCNHIANEDLQEVLDVLVLLPNVYELDLSACSVNSSKANDIRQLTGRAAIKRVYLLDTVLASFSGREMFDGLTVEDAKKVIFIQSPEFLESRIWTNMVRNPALWDPVLRAHNLYFQEFYGNTSTLSLPHVPVAVHAVVKKKSHTALVSQQPCAGPPEPPKRPASTPNRGGESGEVSPFLTSPLLAYGKPTYASVLHRKSYRQAAHLFKS